MIRRKLIDVLKSRQTTSLRGQVGRRDRTTEEEWHALVTNNDDAKKPDKDQQTDPPQGAPATTDSRSQWSLYTAWLLQAADRSHRRRSFSHPLTTRADSNRYQRFQRSLVKLTGHLRLARLVGQQFSRDRP